MKQVTLSEAMGARKPAWTQEELEARSGVSQSTISGILRRAKTNTTARIVQRLEDALGLKRGQLRIEVDSEEQSRLPLKQKRAS